MPPLAHPLDLLLKLGQRRAPAVRNRPTAVHHRPHTPNLLAQPLPLLLRLGNGQAGQLGARLGQLRLCFVGDGQLVAHLPLQCGDFLAKLGNLGRLPLLLAHRKAHLLRHFVRFPLGAGQPLPRLVFQPRQPPLLTAEVIHLPLHIPQLGLRLPRHLVQLAKLVLQLVERGRGRAPLRLPRQHTRLPIRAGQLHQPIGVGNKPLGGHGRCARRQLGLDGSRRRRIRHEEQTTQQRLGRWPHPLIRTAHHLHRPNTLGQVRRGGFSRSPHLHQRQRLRWSLPPHQPPQILLIRHQQRRQTAVQRHLHPPLVFGGDVQKVSQLP